MDSLITENQKEALRKKSLGELGELFAIKTLVDNNFDKIRNLNDDHMNEAYADLICDKDIQKYVISVKARNMYQLNRLENSQYNIGTNEYDKAKKAEEKYVAKLIGWQYSLILIIIQCSLVH